MKNNTVSNQSQYDTLLNETNSVQAQRDAIKLHLRNSVTKKVQSNLWGGGFLFGSKNEEIAKWFRLYDRDFKLLNLFSALERNLSSEGRGIVVMDKLIDGSVKLNIALPYYYNAVAKVFNSPYVAVIFQRMTVDQKLNIMRSTYTTTFVKHELFGTDAEGKQTVLVLNYEEKLKELGLEHYWVHNLGFVPLFELYNIPYFDFYYNTVQYYQLADYYDAAWVEDSIIDAIVNLKRELWLNHSRVLIKDADQKVIQDLATRVKAASGGSVDDRLLSDYIISTENGSETSIVAPSGTFTEYTAVLNQLIDLYFKFCLQSRIGEGGGAQKTAAETGNSRSNLMEYVAQKANFRTIDISNILHKLFVANEVATLEDEYDFTFKINTNLVLDETTKVDNLIKQVDIGAKSIPELISIIDGISLDQAKAKFLEIKEFNDEHEVATGEKEPELANGINTNGRGGAPSKSQVADKDLGGKNDKQS